MISDGSMETVQNDTQLRIFQRVKARVRLESKQMIKVASVAVLFMVIIHGAIIIMPVN